MRESFIFYGSFLSCIDELDNKTQLEIYQAISHYALEGKEPNLTGIAKAIFHLIRPQIDANNKKYDEYQRDVENGRKGAIYGKLGGRPSNKKTPLENPPKTPLENGGVIFENPINDNVNVNENVNVNDNVNENKNVNPDLIFDDKISKFFDIYINQCKDLQPIRFEKRNAKTLNKLEEVLFEIDWDIGTFTELCEKANKLKFICDIRIDFYTMLNNYTGILNGKYTPIGSTEDLIFD